MGGREAEKVGKPLEAWGLFRFSLLDRDCFHDHFEQEVLAHIYLLME